jgi:hypothetical protein
MGLGGLLAMADRRYRVARSRREDRAAANLPVAPLVVAQKVQP